MPPDPFLNAPPSERATVRRLPKRAVYEQAQIEAILDAGLICHAGFVSAGQPYVIPTAYVRAGSQIYFHGSAASRMLRTLAAGAEVSVICPKGKGYEADEETIEGVKVYRHDLPPEGVRAIGKVAESVKRYKGKYTLVVTGYTSSVGGVAFNKALSKRRADAVAKVLVDAGIPAAAIQTAGAGPDTPIADNKTKDGQARNRRVEIEIKADQAVETRKNDTPVS